MKKILVIFILLTTTIFAKINDTLKMFNAEDIQKIDKKISEIEQKKGVEVFVNTYSEDEKIVLTESQNAVVINIIKISPTKIEGEIKISKDIDLDDDSRDSIDELLSLNEKAISEGNTTEYILELLGGIEPLVEKGTVIEEPISDENNPLENNSLKDEVMQNAEENSKFIILGVAIFVIFGIILGIKYKKR